MKKSKIWIFIIGIVFLISLISSILIFKAPAKGTIANIYEDGNCIKSINLSNVIEPYEFNIKTSQKSDSIDLYKNQLNNFNKELTTLNNQKLKLFDLLEREIYSEELFLQRSKDIDSRISLITSEISKINDIINRENLIDHEHNLILLRNVLEGYKLSDDVKDKNELLKYILFKIDYIKKPTEKDDNFEIQLFPKLSK